MTMKYEYENESKTATMDVYFVCILKYTKWTNNYSSELLKLQFCYCCDLLPKPQWNEKNLTVLF